MRFDGRIVGVQQKYVEAFSMESGDGESNCEKGGDGSSVQIDPEETNQIRCGKEWDTTQADITKVRSAITNWSDRTQTEMATMGTSWSDDGDS